MIHSGWDCARPFCDRIRPTAATGFLARPGKSFGARLSAHCRSRSAERASDATARHCQRIKRIRRTRYVATIWRPASPPMMHSIRLRRGAFWLAPSKGIKVVDRQQVQWQWSTPRVQLALKELWAGAGCNVANCPVPLGPLRQCPNYPLPNRVSWLGANDGDLYLLNNDRVLPAIVKNRWLSGAVPRRGVNCGRVLDEAVTARSPTASIAGYCGRYSLKRLCSN
jgi:hypothetical protein